MVASSVEVEGLYSDFVWDLKVETLIIAHIITIATLFFPFLSSLISEVMLATDGYVFFSIFVPRS
jgi:hypothetical protein